MACAWPCGRSAANKLRTSLTVLGMVIGVAAVIALMSLGAGAQASIESNIRGTGSNSAVHQPRRPGPDRRPVRGRERDDADPDPGRRRGDS